MRMHATSIGCRPQTRTRLRSKQGRNRAKEKNLIPPERGNSKTENTNEATQAQAKKGKPMKNKGND